ncbi:hypothetical protein DACRYDRAFT_113610 [Dacryopinax primogenitus]|uniref:Uncharacterized protein n=1 Tax=Dacryopinax primogenitus (strain DJM 731) TaxID=1858805 RepID=M5GAW5_DACPD|nr:uncharacterized protein DACRYDRAFT_113610 [Dacryopinax primogenitus]EJU05525.1 hypothetical protein DACRYDRAFT_113610 [Dacryopinax primogenitus]
MASITEIYNANPIIAASVNTARTKPIRHETRYLWSDDPDSKGPLSGLAGSREESDEDSEEGEEIDNIEIFELLRGIYDPEHPLTLEQLQVVNPSHIFIRPPNPPSPGAATNVLVEFTPTVPHCGMSTIIGLALRVRLLRALPERMKVDIRVRKGSHQSENALNKQLNDKERVAAALENTALLEVVEKCLAGEQPTLI